MSDYLRTVTALLLLLLLTPLAAGSPAREANIAKTSRPAAAKLLVAIERDLNVFLSVAPGLLESGMPVGRAEKSRLFEIHSRTQRSFRVLSLHRMTRGDANGASPPDLFADEYATFVRDLRELHRALVLDGEVAGPLGSSLRSARRSLQALRPGTS